MSRRRLLRGGLAAAPVLMTLVSRPVFAQQCTTPSGYVSANASTAGRGVACSGHTPEFWVQHPGDWPGNIKPADALFNQIFSPPLSLGNNTNPLLIDVLGSSTNNVARYVSAAYLNAVGVLTPVLSISAVKDIWSEFATTMHFSPSSGASWTEAEIIEYLLTTTA